MSKYPTLTHYDSLLKMPAYTKAHVYLRSMRRGVCKKHEVKSSPNKFGIRPTIKTVHSSKSYLHRYLQLLLILSWTPNTSLWRTVFLVPEESSHLFSKFKPLNTDGPSMSTTENFSCLINRFSQKVSLAYVDTSLSTGCRHMLLRVKNRLWVHVNFLNATMHLADTINFWRQFQAILCPFTFTASAIYIVATTVCSVKQERISEMNDYNNE